MTYDLDPVCVTLTLNERVISPGNLGVEPLFVVFYDDWLLRYGVFSLSALLLWRPF